MRPTGLGLFRSLVNELGLAATFIYAQRSGGGASQPPAATKRSRPPSVVVVFGAAAGL